MKVHVADAALRARIEHALAAVTFDAPPCEPAIVHVARGVDLVAAIDAHRRAGAVAIQLVWDGTDRRLERHVFAALEHGRSQPTAAPVVLARTTDPPAALRILVAHWRQT